MRKYDASHDELIFYSYGFGSIVLLFFSIVSMELRDGIAFLHQQGATATCCLVVFCSCGYFGVTCVAALTKKFGALTSTMTTTARKALTLFLSFFIFPKPATMMHVFGGILFVVGLTIKAVPSSRQKSEPVSSSSSPSKRSSSSSSSSSSSRKQIDLTGGGAQPRPLSRFLSTNSSALSIGGGGQRLGGGGSSSGWYMSSTNVSNSSPLDIESSSQSSSGGRKTSTLTTV